MLEIADERVPMQVEARCWCGREPRQRAGGQRRHHLRGRDGGGRRHRDAPASPLFGDVVSYELLCRPHYRAGELGA